MTDPDPITRLNAALEGRYRIASELGEGGMATVYLADDIKHERKVALKVLKPELAAVVGAKRFLAEIKTTANLTHPHILPLFDSGVLQQNLWVDRHPERWARADMGGRSEEPAACPRSGGNAGLVGRPTTASALCGANIAAGSDARIWPRFSPL